MWKRDRENYDEEERRLTHKVKSINQQNADFLQKQMDEKEEARKGRMNMNEYLLNKQLLKGINGQPKEGSSAVGSIRSGFH
mmetsp:Transcript_22695/g.20174  ORF Transcript_22695/g.20174 Transcript_22695/m.20174 type:complete len:81 (+) Transcript_22695:46-288(+)